MSFGQALFFGSAGYGVALLARDLGITDIFLVLPAGTLIGLVLSRCCSAASCCSDGIPPSVIFVALGTLTGSYAADRLARGWYYLGGQNGIPSIPPMTLGWLRILEGPAYYYLVLGDPRRRLSALPLPGALAIRPGAGGLREQRAAHRLLRLQGPALKAIIFAIGGAIAGLAGGLYAFHEGFVWPNMVGVVVSTQVVLYVLFGGVGTLIGAVIGVVDHRGA